MILTGFPRFDDLEEAHVVVDSESSWLKSFFPVKNPFKEDLKIVSIEESSVFNSSEFLDSYFDEGKKEEVVVLPIQSISE